MNNTAKNNAPTSTRLDANDTILGELPPKPIHYIRDKVCNSGSTALPKLQKPFGRFVPAKSTVSRSSSTL
jgi:hypothetical protein